MPLVKLCVILNLNAGSAGQVERGLYRIGPHTLVTTSAPGQATQIAAEALREGYTRIVAAGGDGTLNEVLNGLAEGLDRVELGLIPLGTANDFARSANVPVNIEDALDLVARGESRPVDIVRQTSAGQKPRYFINVSAGGFSTKVDQKLDKRSKDWWGSLSYAFSAVKALPELEQYQAEVTFDDEQTLTVPVYTVVVANATYVGGGIPVAPLASLDDGQFDVVIFRAVTLARLTKVLLGQHLEDEDVLFRQVRRFRIASEPSFELNADGEIVGVCPALFEIVPKAVRFIVGPPAAQT